MLTTPADASRRVASGPPHASTLAMRIRLIPCLLVFAACSGTLAPGSDAAAAAALKAAEAAGLTTDSKPAFDPLLGDIIKAADGSWIHGGGRLLKRLPAATAARAGELNAIQSAGQAFLRALDAERGPGALDQRARATLVEIVGLLHRPSGKREFDEITHDVARRMARGGYFEQFPALTTQGADLRAAVEAACTLRPVGGYADGETRLIELKDAFGRTARESAVDGVRQYQVRHPELGFLQTTVDGQVVIELKADGTPRRLALYRQQELALEWIDGKGLAERTPWDGIVGNRLGSGGYHLPAHIMATTMNGDPLALAVEGGVLRALRDSSPAEIERFLTQSAKLLPTPSHLDLIGQYFFFYTYDSPDTRYPMLSGTKTVRGEQHNTAQQTLATQTFGQFRGDCDDAAELYQEIGNRQGRLGHVASLPGHAAYVTASQETDGWQVHVLQTGDHRRFEDAQLPLALKAAFESFMKTSGEKADPDGLGLLLRFNGENTRGSWRLGWRIYAEPDYARTMIEVQRDWHLHTYARGIEAMKKMIAAGDKDPANYSELSGLYNFTGQYPLAIDYFNRSLDLQESEDEKFQRRFELLGLMQAGGRTDDAKVLMRALAKRLLDPETQRGMGPLFTWNLSSMLLGRAQQLGDLALFEELVEGPLAPLAAQVPNLAKLAAAKTATARAQWEHPRTEALRQLTRMYLMSGLGAITAMPSASRSNAAAQALTGQLDAWMNGVMFRDIDEPSEVLARYALLAQRWTLDEDAEAIAAKVAAAPWPVSTAIDHVVRKPAGDAAGRARDLSWIRLSPQFWFQRLLKATGTAEDENATDQGGAAADAARIRAAHQAFLDAVAQCEKLKLIPGETAHLRTTAALAVGLHTQDAALITATFKDVVARNDKRLRDAVANQIGNAAKKLPAEWFSKVLDLWKADIDYKPLWFAIAWRARLTGAPDKALTTAERAVKAHPDEKAFAEELAFMRSLDAAK